MVLWKEWFYGSRKKWIIKQGKKKFELATEDCYHRFFFVLAVAVVILCGIF